MAVLAQSQVPPPGFQEYLRTVDRRAADRMYADRIYADRIYAESTGIQKGQTREGAPIDGRLTGDRSDFASLLESRIDQGEKSGREAAAREAFAREADAEEASAHEAGWIKKALSMSKAARDSLNRLSKQMNGENADGEAANSGKAKVHHPSAKEKWDLFIQGSPLGRKKQPGPQSAEARELRASEHSQAEISRQTAEKSADKKHISDGMRTMTFLISAAAHAGQSAKEEALQFFKALKEGGKTGGQGAGAGIKAPGSMTGERNIEGTGKPKIVIVDLRTAVKAGGKGAGKGSENGAVHRTGSKITDSESSIEKDSDAKITTRWISAPGGEAPRTIQSKEDLQATRPQVPQRFQEYLKSEVVRSSSIILRNEGQGELRLILKPESLGNVRIKLSLNNNHIEGRIIVENNSVKEMFESNLQNLNNAFVREGFASSSLQVSVGNDNSREKAGEKGVSN
ncbi:MAG TPA: flagellar hook-length control protein FliK, partial [Spirochaetia bacterium]|nr:flagellar hook-length control protein FliK [Spirochaetia bacterium]